MTWGGNEQRDDRMALPRRLRAVDRREAICRGPPLAPARPKMASITARRQRMRGRPPLLARGSNGPIGAIPSRQVLWITCAVAFRLPAADISPGQVLPSRFSTERGSQCPDIAELPFNRVFGKASQLSLRIWR